MRTSRRKEHLASKWFNRRPETAILGFRLVLYLVLLGSQVRTVKATDKISTHRDADRTATDLVPKFVGLAGSSNSFRKEGHCEEEEGKKKSKNKKKEAAKRRTQEPLKKTATERSRRPLKETVRERTR